MGWVTVVNGDGCAGFLLLRWLVRYVVGTEMTGNGWWSRW